MRLLFTVLMFPTFFTAWGQINFPEGSKILCLGDSRVEGSDTYDSYRYELWKDLIDCNWDFDFVGTQIDPLNYSLYENNSFDSNHQGIGGFTTSDVLSDLPYVLSSIGTIDIVLLGIGGNDALNDGSVSVPFAMANINSIIELLQSNNPQVLILLEQIAPGLNSMMTPDLIQAISTFNSDIEIVANNQTNATGNVIVVDMNTGWQNSYLADDVHYNSMGAEVVASRYSDALKIFYHCNSFNSIQEISEKRSTVKTVDVVGRKVNQTTNQLLFHIYDDGSVEKKFILE